MAFWIKKSKQKSTCFSVHDAKEIPRNLCNSSRSENLNQLQSFSFTGEKLATN